MVVRARDVMTTRVVAVSPETSLDRARGLLTENRFSALPVVGAGHRLVGIVTSLDLLRAMTEEAPSALATATVGAVMTRDPMSMTPDAAITIIAHRLREYGERRVMPIVERGMLVGIVTRADLLAPAAGALRRFVNRTRRPVRTRPGPWADAAPRTGPTAADVMTPVADVLDVIEETPVAEAAAILRANRFTALPVLDVDSHVLGVVSEADLVPDRLSGRRTPPPSTVGRAMTREVVSTPHGTRIEDLARLMVDRGLRMLPVLDDHHRMVGVVSRGDVLRAMAKASP